MCNNPFFSLKYEIDSRINYIRESLINSELEADININNCFNDLTNYIEKNILNYVEIKKVFLHDIKNTTKKQTFKQYLTDNLSSEYYINNLLNV